MKNVLHSSYHMGYTTFSLFNLFKGEKQMKETLKDIIAILTRSELWVTIVVVLGALQQSGSLPDGWTKVVTILLAVLAALGYTTARTLKKISDNK